MFFKWFLGTEYNLARGDEAQEFSFEATRTALLLPPGHHGFWCSTALDQMTTVVAKKVGTGFLGEEKPGQRGTGIGCSVPGQDLSSIWCGSQARTWSRRLLFWKEAMHPQVCKGNVRGRGTERMAGERGLIILGDKKEHEKWGPLGSFCHVLLVVKKISSCDAMEIFFPQSTFVKGKWDRFHWENRKTKGVFWKQIAWTYVNF